MRVTVDRFKRVGVAFDDVAYLRDVPLPDAWHPRPHWVFGIGAELHNESSARASPLPLVSGAAGVRIDNWRLESGFLHPLHEAPLRASFNGQQYTDPLPFQYYRPPVLSEASPSSGPLSGGTRVTLHGEALGSGTHRLCRFGGGVTVDANVSAAPCLTPAPPLIAQPPEQRKLWQPPLPSPECSRVECISPATNAPSKALLEVSLNGQQFHSSRDAYSPTAYTLLSDAAVRFRHADAPIISSLTPRGGPIAGATNVTVRGASFASSASNYTCQWAELPTSSGGGTPPPPPYAVTLATRGEGAAASSQVHCLAPRVQAPRELALRISANAQQYTQPSSTNLTFTFYEPPHVRRTEPAGGDLQGGTFISLFGSGLDTPPTADGVGLHCKFGQFVVPAVNGSRCVLPSDHTAGVGFEADDTSLQLFGSARQEIVDASPVGIFRITRLTEGGKPFMVEGGSGMRGPVGYAILPLPPPDHDAPSLKYQAMRVSFKLLVDGEGEGFSFSYGRLPDEPPTYAPSYAENPSGRPAGVRLRPVYGAAALGESGGRRPARTRPDRRRARGPPPQPPLPPPPPPLPPPPPPPLPPPPPSLPAPPPLPPPPPLPHLIYHIPRRAAGACLRAHHLRRRDSWHVRAASAPRDIPGRPVAARARRISSARARRVECLPPLGCLSPHGALRRV